MSNNSIPVGLQDLLTKLDFLSQITRGNKPCMTNMTIVGSNSWFGSLYRRYWVKETRKSIITDIEKLIENTIDSITTHKDTIFLPIIVNALSEARVGIESLKTTYRDDPEIRSRVTVTLKNIDLQLDAHRNLIKGYKDSSDTSQESTQQQQQNHLQSIIQEKDKTPPKILTTDKPRRRKMKLDEEKSDKLM